MRDGLVSRVRHKTKNPANLFLWILTEERANFFNEVVHVEVKEPPEARTIPRTFDSKCRRYNTTLSSFAVGERRDALEETGEGDSGVLDCRVHAVRSWHLDHCDPRVCDECWIIRMESDIEGT